MTCVVWLGLWTALVSCGEGPAAAERPRKIVLIAGPKSHGPVGNGIHDYGWCVKLIQVMLQNSNVRDRVKVEHHLGGWPREPRTLNDADCIMIVSDGRDGDRFAEAPHLATPERVRFFDAQMKRGCGLVTFHFSTFAPEKHREAVLAWNGGYFQWEQKGKRDWYSAIRTLEADVKIASEKHPIARGVKPFKLREEFYYNLRLAAEAVPIAEVPALKGREERGNVVAWAMQRKAGRGFGTTCGHFYDNWKNPAFRKLMLNGLVWAAGVEVPEGGVEAKFYTHEEIDRALARVDVPRALLIAGNEAHKWHNWEKTTPRIREVLEKEGAFKVDVSLDIEDLGRKKRGEYAVIVLNYCNWQDGKPLSESSRSALVEHLKSGGGLVCIHFANGAFHYSLPKAGGSDWPEYRKIVPRVWNHTPAKGKPRSGHDAFGRFVVRPTALKHAITAGLKPFEVVDELYFHQDGEAAIEPLIVAESKITKKMEPLAWTSRYGKGRVFQTLLGHSEKTYESAEACEVLRRGTQWAAGRLE